ncbi:MAG: hypothetical protein JSR82_16740 [Verrucomicrobia bacterium]|nr:hypothetical protein [Verrucomicrobiota bacterium]
MLPSPSSPERPAADAADQSIARALRGAGPPAGLKERILAARAAALEAELEAKTVRGPWFMRPSIWLAAAAMLVAAFAVLTHFGQTRSFDDFRTRVVAVDARKVMGGGLPWAIRTPDRATLNAYLRQANLPGQVEAIQPPAAYGALGCRVFQWKGIRYSVVCFYEDEKHGVHLFMASSASFAQPPGETPQFAQLGGLPVATWSKDGVSYILVGSESLDLREMLPRVAET